MVTENYGPTFFDMPKKKRQSILKERYWFQCGCQACKDDWPTIKKMNQSNRLPLRCDQQNCNSKILIDPMRGKFLAKCGTCSKTKNIMKSLKILQVKYVEVSLKIFQNLNFSPRRSEKILKLFFNFF